MKHFIIDFETIGQNSRLVPAIDCSYTTFEWDRFTSNNPYSLRELVEHAQQAKFDIKDQMVNHGVFLGILPNLYIPMMILT